MLITSATAADNYSPTGVYVFLILLSVAGAVTGSFLLLNIRNYRDRIITNATRGAEMNRLRGDSPFAGPLIPSHRALKYVGSLTITVSMVVVLLSALSLIKHD